MTDVNYAKIEKCLDTNNVSEAIALLEDAASKDSAEAMFDLGMLYYRGEYVSPDAIKARNWLEKADKAGHRDAPYYIGRICSNYGDNCTPTESDAVQERSSEDVAQEWYETAMCWYRRAAERGSHYGLARVGYNFLHGIGVKKSSKTAYQYFVQAKSAGNIGAHIMVARMLMLGHCGAIGVFRGAAEFIGVIISIWRLRKTEPVQQIHRRFEY